MGLKKTTTLVGMEAGAVAEESGMSAGVLEGIDVPQVPRSIVSKEVFVDMAIVATSSLFFFSA